MLILKCFRLFLNSPNYKCSCHVQYFTQPFQPECIQLARRCIWERQGHHPVHKFTSDDDVRYSKLQLVACISSCQAKPASNVLNPSPKTMDTLFSMVFYNSYLSEPTVLIQGVVQHTTLASEMENVNHAES